MLILGQVRLGKGKLSPVGLYLPAGLEIGPQNLFEISLDIAFHRKVHLIH